MDQHITQGQVDAALPKAASSTLANSGSVTPELVREIADRVYALLKKDLQIERERMRRLSSSRQSGGFLW
ncbi:MAG: hypothetical protein JXR84_25675 [Anaerolineae bacterium]|nr:hypothetical protein [Anaerolineae bacterium]